MSDVASRDGAESRDAVDLRSDTVTQPTPGMREAIARAVVGDDTLGDDPTVRALEERVAELLGKQAALFFPSGIMANETALILHTRPGTEVVCEATCHFIDWELGGPAALAGVHMRGIPTTDGVLTADAVAAAIRAPNPIQVQTSAITIENTHNGAGGRITPIGTMRAIADVARDRNLPVHLDGARLWNATTASGVPLDAYAACADTVMVAMSKGLGCPVGSLLAGTREHMQHARVIRRRLGGAMRQAGILAAAGIYALDHHVERLADDHARARQLAKHASTLQGLSVVEPDTNIVMMDVTRSDMTANDVVRELGRHGVMMTAFTSRRVRAVTHMDIDDSRLSHAADALARVMAA
jgi:threonine aldolase